MPRLSIEIDERMKNKFKSKASGEGLNMRDVIIKLIENYLSDKN